MNIVSYTFTPAENYNGLISGSYTINDGCCLLMLSKLLPIVDASRGYSDVDEDTFTFGRTL